MCVEFFIAWHFYIDVDYVENKYDEKNNNNNNLAKKKG
jgi:hypothetical protein